MKDMKVRLEGFQKEYKALTIDLQETNKPFYDLGILLAYYSELHNDFMVKKQLKTTKRGTKFNYVSIKDIDEYNLYHEKLNEMLNTVDTELMASGLNTIIDFLKTKVGAKNE